MDSANKGFSFIETLIVLGIMATLFSLTAPSIISSYGDYQFREERNVLVSTLRRARSISMTGANGKDHGLKIASSSYVIFEGSSWNTRDISKDIDSPRNPSIAITGGSEIVFSYLTGKSTTTLLTISEGSNVASISINQEGLVSW